jgi:hypothetical protein
MIGDTQCLKDDVYQGLNKYLVSLLLLLLRCSCDSLMFGSKERVIIRQ